MVLAGSRRPHRGRRRLPARTADRLASARGRDAGALRRTELARRALSYGADRARRSAAALPLRLARRAPRRRARRAAALLGALRGRVRARRRAPRAADRRRGPGADRDRSRLRQLDAPLPRDLRADVQPVPLDQRRLVPGLPRRGGARRWTALGALGACRAPHRRDAPLRRARPRLAGRLCTRARAHASCVCSRSARWPLLGTPFWYSDLVLAGRFDVGVGSGGKKLDGPWAVLDYLFRVAGDFTAGYTLAIVAVLVVAAVGARVLWLSESERGLADRRRDRRSDGGVPARAVRRVDLARVAPSDLRAPVLRGAGRARPDPADAAEDSDPRRCRRRPRRRRGRVGLGQDGSAVQGRAGEPRRGAQGGFRVAGPEGAKGRRPLRLRAALSRRLGARPQALLDARSSRGRTRSSRSTRCARRSRSATASGSSTPRTRTTSRSR